MVLSPSHLPFQHLAEEVRQTQIAAFVVDVRGHVADDMSENVETNQVDGAERRRPRPATACAGERVDFFDGQIHFLHQPHHVQHRKCSNAVADEVGRVFRQDYAFTKMHVAEVRDGVDQRGVGFGRGNEFEQAHVAWRIEKMRAKPRAPEIVRESFGNLAYRQAAGVSGDDRAGLADGFYFFQ